MSAQHENLLARYDPDTSLADIPWTELPAELQETCWDFIRKWQNDLGINELREISGLNDMNLAELLAYKERKYAVHRGD